MHRRRPRPAFCRPTGGAGALKPIHEERIRQGIITNWSVYGVVYAAPNAPYNFVIVNVFDDFAKLENFFPEEVLTTAHSGGDLDTLMERTFASRELVHSEVWLLVDSAQPEGEAAPRQLILWRTTE